MNRYRLASVIAATAVTLVVSSCGLLPGATGGVAAGEPRPDLARSQRVTAEGGEFHTEGLRLSVPAGAIGADDRAEVALGRVGAVFDVGFGPEEIGQPVQVEHEQPLTQDVTVVWDLPADMSEEEAATLALVRWDDERKLWTQTDQPFIIADGKLEAKLRDFSIWTWLTSNAPGITQTAGEWTGTRSGELDCSVARGAVPADWVSGAVLPDTDQPAMPLRTCLDPDTGERITLRVASNRRFAQHLTVAEGEPFAWRWPGETDYTPAGIITGLAADALSDDRGVVLKATRAQAVGIARPATPGMHSVKLESRIDAASVAVDVVAVMAENLGGDVQAFESPVVNATVQSLFDCGGERLLQSRQVDPQALVRDVIEVLHSCRNSEAVAIAIEDATRAEIAKGGSAGVRAEQAARWSHKLGAKLGVALRVWDASHYTAELISTVELGPTQVSMQLRGKPQALGAWTATCTDARADTDNLFRNIFWQEEFRDTGKELHEFPGFPAAADAAIAPLAGCGKDHQEEVAGEVEGTWADKTAGRIVAEAMARKFDLAGCRLSLDTLRTLAGDPAATVERQQCTADKQWLVATGVFRPGGRADRRTQWMILRRDNGQWKRVALLEHGGDCVSMFERGAPIKEIDRLVGGFPCAPIVAGQLLEREVITTNGIGDLRIGMTTQQALAAGYLERSNQGAGCSPYQSAFSLNQRQLLVSLDSGRVNGLLFKDRRWRTQAGARVGDSESRIRSLYPNLVRGIDPPSGLPTLSVVASNGNRVSFVIWEGSRVGAISVEDGARPPGWSGC